METTNSSELKAPVGTGSTQLLCETYIRVKPGMSKKILEFFTAEITGYTVFNDKVLVTGTVEHMFHYLHPHGLKANNNEQDADSNRDSAATTEEKIDTFKCLDGWGSLLNYYGGIVHFHQQNFEFTGTVTIPGVIPTDIVTGTVQVKDYDQLDATEIEETGLLTGGTQRFKIDVALTATRNP